MSITLVNSTHEYDWRTRPATDFYPTPHEVTQALLNFLEIEKDAKIWEPACGDGHMVKSIQANGYTVVSGDIRTGQDFLQQDHNGCDWIITNPPFCIAESFIRHAASMPLDGFALLLKSQYWHSANRLKLFNEIKPAFVMPLTWRPDFLFGSKSGSPTMEVLWTVWTPEYGRTKYVPLGRPERIEKRMKGER